MFEDVGDDGLTDTQREMLWQLVHSDNEDEMIAVSELVDNCKMVSQVLWSWLSEEVDVLSTDPD